MRYLGSCYLLCGDCCVSSGLGGFWLGFGDACGWGIGFVVVLFLEAGGCGVSLLVVFGFSGFGGCGLGCCLRGLVCVWLVDY